MHNYFAPNVFSKFAPLNDYGGSIGLLNVSIASPMLHGSSRRVLALWYRVRIKVRKILKSSVSAEINQIVSMCSGNGV